MGDAEREALRLAAKRAWGDVRGPQTPEEAGAAKRLAEEWKAKPGKTG